MGGWFNTGRCSTTLLFYNKLARCRVRAIGGCLAGSERRSKVKHASPIRARFGRFGRISGELEAIQVDAQLANQNRAGILSNVMRGYRSILAAACDAISSTRSARWTAA